MARIISVDYGVKRCGLAATDPLQIIVNPLTTVATTDLLNYLTAYLYNEKVEKIVFGRSVHKDGTDNYIMTAVNDFVRNIQNKWPEIEVDFQDESFTSSQALDILIQSGIPKKKRQDKSLIDKMSAVLILQRYLKHI